LRGGVLEVVTTYAQVVGENGETIPLSTARPLLPVDDRVRAVVAGRADRFFSDVEIEGSDVRVLTVPIASGALQVARQVDDVSLHLVRIAGLMTARSTPTWSPSPCTPCVHRWRAPSATSWTTPSSSHRPVARSRSGCTQVCSGYGTTGPASRRPTYRMSSTASTAPERSGGAGVRARPGHRPQGRRHARLVRTRRERPGRWRRARRAPTGRSFRAIRSVSATVPPAKLPAAGTPTATTRCPGAAGAGETGGVDDVPIAPPPGRWCHHQARTPRDDPTRVVDVVNRSRAAPPGPGQRWSG
jgi:hypothetical protein